MDIAGRRPLLLFPMLAMVLDLALMTVCLILQVSTAHFLTCVLQILTSCVVLSILYITELQYIHCTSFTYQKN